MVPGRLVAAIVSPQALHMFKKYLFEYDPANPSVTSPYAAQVEMSVRGIHPLKKESVRPC
jgi:hypothetical protein